MKKYAFGLLVAAMSLQSSVALAFGFGGCCEGYRCGRNFDGLYIGGNMGVLTHSAYREDFNGFLTTISDWTSLKTGFTGGAQIGYDYECNSTVLGLVWDFNGATTSRTFHVAPNSAGDRHLHNKQLWLSTLRGRAGVTVCDALLYVTAGLAVQNVRTNWSSGQDFFNYKQTRYGWTAGVGTEFVACDCWTFGFDLLGMQFDSKHKAFRTRRGVDFVGGHSDQVWAGRFLLNYRFEELFCCW